MENYMFLYLNTGGGHKSTAKSVAEKMIAEKPGLLNITLTDGLINANRLAKYVLEDGYRKSVNQALWVFEMLYAVHKIHFIAKTTASLVSKLIKPGLEDEIILKQPDKIVIFHFFLVQPVKEILKKHGLKIPCIITVTDPFTAHPIWFLHKEQNYLVFSEELKEKCIKNGIREKNLKVLPFPLNAKFLPEKNNLNMGDQKLNLGFAPQLKLILILGGGDGMPHGMKILKNISEKNMEAEIAMVCGRNEKLYKKAMKYKKTHNANNLKIYGFIDFVHDLIGISDIVITKCGPSTIMEILMMGKVPVINNYIWEQEKGNMEFVCRQKMGILEKRIQRLAGLIESLLFDKNAYNTLKNNILNASLKNGVGQVSEYILNYRP
ncbi:MAG: glycosyltransferase [Bacteroidales bacterium]